MLPHSALPCHQVDRVWPRPHIILLQNNLNFLIATTNGRSRFAFAFFFLSCCWWYKNCQQKSLNLPARRGRWRGRDPLASLIVRPGWWVIKLFYDLVFHGTLPPSLHCLPLHLLRLLTLWSASTWSLSSFTQRCAARRAMGAGLSCQSGSGRGPLSVLITCCCWSWNRSVICVTGAVAGKSLSLHYCWLFICRCAWLQHQARRGEARRDVAESSEQQAAWTTCWLLACSFLAKTLPSSGCHAPTRVSIYALAGGSKRNCGIEVSQKVKVQVERCCCSSDNNKVVVLFIASNGGRHIYKHTHTHTDWAEMPHELLIERRFKYVFVIDKLAIIS